MFQKSLPLSSPMALLQGGLANQLLQSALIATEEEISLGELNVSCCLLDSWLRSLRLVTKRSLSPLLDSHVVEIPFYQKTFLRMRFRLPIARETLYDGALFRVIIHGQRFYKGDGLSPIVFSAKYNCFWLSVLHALDSLFGATPSTQSDLAVHVRWGDYHSLKTQRGAGLYPLPLHYYLSALDFLQSRSSAPLQSCFFSDSPGQVRQAFAAILHDPFNVSQGASVEKDLWNMSFSKYLVLSNSTLSCVAAHLSKLRNGRVDIIAPSRWFLDGFHSSRFDIRQPEWIMI